MRAMHLTGALVLGTLLSGCAYSYVAPDGSRHVLGLLHVVVPPDAEASAPAASLRTRALGLSLTSGGVGSALALGYSDVTLAYVRGDTCVRWPLQSPLIRHTP